MCRVANASFRKLLYNQSLASSSPTRKMVCDSFETQHIKEQFGPYRNFNRCGIAYDVPHHLTYSRNRGLKKFRYVVSMSGLLRVIGITFQRSNYPLLELTSPDVQFWCIIVQSPKPNIVRIGRAGKRQLRPLIESVRYPRNITLESGSSEQFYHIACKPQT